MGAVGVDFKGSIVDARRQIDAIGVRRQIEVLRGDIDEADYSILDLFSGEDIGTIDDVEADLGDLLERIKETLPEEIVRSPKTYTQLRRLLAWRVNTVDKIGKIKRENNIQPYDANREEEHTRDLLRRYPEQEALINSLFPVIYSYCRERQDGNSN